MRPRSASEWRRFWHEGGERELELVVRGAWPPLANAADEVARTQTERIALLLSSAAPVRALERELGRIRAELGEAADSAADAAAARRVRAWFAAQTLA